MRIYLMYSIRTADTVADGWMLVSVWGVRPESGWYNGAMSCLVSSGRE